MTNYPAKIYGDKKLILTRDGSFSFYSLSYGESYKTKSVGAYSESRRKFVDAGRLSELFGQGDVRLLDICFGCGMNLAATIEEYLKIGAMGRLHIVSVEKDASLLNLVETSSFLFPIGGYRVLRELLRHGRWGNITLELYIDDARRFLSYLDGIFDVIYFDPFSSKHNIEMWTDEIFIKLRSLLKVGGGFMTYASNASLREMLGGLGFRVQKIKSLGGRNHPSIRCEKVVDLKNVTEVE